MNAEKFVLLHVKLKQLKKQVGNTEPSNIQFSEQQL